MLDFFVQKFLIKCFSFLKDFILIPMKLAGNEIEIRFRKTWVKLTDFSDLSEKTDDGIYYNYFISLIDLFADLCLNRNYLAIEFLENLYEFDLCLLIITRKEFSSSLRFDF